MPTNESSEAFASNVKKQLEADPSLKRRGKRVLAVIDGPDTPRRRRLLKRMEAHTRVELGISALAPIDWSAIDWPALIQTILKLLLALLPLLFADGPEGPTQEGG